MKNSAFSFSTGYGESVADDEEVMDVGETVVVTATRCKKKIAGNVRVVRFCFLLYLIMLVLPQSLPPSDFSSK